MKIRKGYRKLHIDGDIWQYKWGKSYINIYSPTKKYCVKKDTFYIQMYGEENYQKRIRDLSEWRNYSWDKIVSPEDFDLELPSFRPSFVKAYIEEKLLCKK